MVPMEDSITEAGYPLSFRRNNARELGKCLKDLNSVVLIGMKRVGINNFLRFFLYNKNIMGEHVNDRRKHLFISVDLHDLVEESWPPHFADRIPSASCLKL